MPSASLGRNAACFGSLQATLRELHLDTDGFAFSSADLWNLTHFKQLVILNVVVGSEVHLPLLMTAASELSHWPA